MWKTSATWAAGYQPMATATKTVKSGLAKPTVCFEGYKMYGGTNTSVGPTIFRGKKMRFYAAGFCIFRGVPRRSLIFQ